MDKRRTVLLSGAIAGVVVLAFAAGILFTLSAGTLFAQTAPATPTMTHEQMDQMMDTMHGDGASQRMHEAMGPDADRLMDQCVAMMNMMGSMQGMMGNGSGQSMQGMMDRMMGR